MHVPKKRANSRLPRRSLSVTTRLPTWPLFAPPQLHSNDAFSQTGVTVHRVGCYTHPLGGLGDGQGATEDRHRTPRPGTHSPPRKLGAVPFKTCTDGERYGKEKQDRHD